MPFHYDTPDNSRAVGSIAELMLRKGDIAAQRAQQTGAIAATAAQQIGQTASAAIQQVPALQAAAKTRNIITTTPKIDLGGGVMGYDVATIADATTKAGGDPATAIQHLTALNQSFQQLQASRLASMQTGAKAVIAGGNDPVLAGDFLDAVEKNGIYPPATIQKWRGLIKSDPANVAKITSFLAGPQKDEILPEGATAVNPLTHQVTAQGTPKPPTKAELALKAGEGDPSAQAAMSALNPAPQVNPEVARHNQEMERIAGLNAGKADAAQKETERHNRAMEAHATATDDSAPALTPDAIKLTAHQFAMTGQLPPMGMGKAGAKLRTDIINAAADEYKNLDLPSQVAAYNANKDSLKKLQVQRDAITSFEATAGKNIDIFLNAAGKVVDTGSPLANSLARQVSGKMLGSPDQAAYDAARQVAVNEIAKITSNPNLSGSLSDSARHEIDAFNPASATLAQSVKVMRLLKKDMANRATSMDDTIKAVQLRISTPPGGSAPPDGGVVQVGKFKVKVGG